MSEKSKGHKEHPADNDQNRPGTYFLPGQIVFHIAGVASPESIQALIDWANS